MTKAIRELERIARDNKRRPNLIEAAREEGASWEQITQALDMSRAGVIKLHNTLDRA
jgi:biotin operon repressor